MFVEKLCESFKANGIIDEGVIPFDVCKIERRDLSDFVPFDRNCHTYEVIGFRDAADGVVIIATGVKNPADVTTLITTNIMRGFALREFYMLDCGASNVVAMFLW